MSENIFTIHSSNGEIIVDKETGTCIEFDCNESISNITRFDVKENEKYNDRKIENGDNLDILDFGYWYTSVKGIEEYEEPAHDWRKEIIELQKDNL